MYRRKWFLFAIIIATGGVILIIFHTDDTRHVRESDGLSQLTSHTRNGANLLSNKKTNQSKSGATEDSENRQNSFYENKYDIAISRNGKRHKSISLNRSTYNITKNLEGVKQTKHKAFRHFSPTNQISTNFTQNNTFSSGSTQARQPTKLVRNKSADTVQFKGKGNTNNAKDSHEETDNSISVQSMDLKLEWMKIREEKRMNEEDKLMLQKQRKLLEQQQMELEQEKIKLAEEIRRFKEYRRRLDEIHQKSQTLSEKQATPPPARKIENLWQGLDPHKVETKYPGIQLDGDYMLRPFVDPDDPRAMGMFGNPRTIEEMTEAQAEERFYQLVSVEHVHCSDVRRMGNMGDGGWDVCVVEPFKPHLGCLIYSFGINNDFTFDDAMSETFSCDVKSFDPSMNVDDHMHSDNVLFYNLGLGSKNNITEKEWNIMTLSAILAKLGHTENTIDYLKFDIEFSEWDSLQNMLRDKSLANVKQLAFEIHTAEVVHVNRQSTKDDYVQWYSGLLGLEHQGFRRFHYHFNPYGRFTSLRSGRDRSCCYELYYINLKFLDTNR